MIAATGYNHAGASPSKTCERGNGARRARLCSALLCFKSFMQRDFHHISKAFLALIRRQRLAGLQMI